MRNELLRMRPFSLQFNDPTLEAEFTSELYRGSLSPFIGFCGLTMLTLVTLAFVTPESRVTNIFCCCVIGFWLMARLRIDRMADVQKARLYWGRMLVVPNFFMWPTFAVFYSLEPPEPAPAITVVASAGIWIVLPIYLRYSGMLSAHRIAYVGYSFLGFFMLPSYSVIGWPTEAIALGGATLLGDLLGFTLEHYWRQNRLAAHERERQARLASLNAAQVHEAQLAAHQHEVRRLEQEMRGLAGERQRLIEERQTFCRAVYSKHLKERTEGGSRSSRGRPSSRDRRDSPPRQPSPLREEHKEAEDTPEATPRSSMGSFARLAQRRGWTA